MIQAHTYLHLFYFAGINLLIVILGYLFIKKKLIILSWLMLASTVLAVHLIFLHEHAILRMLAIIATTFTAMKVIAVTESYLNKPLTITFKQWFIFATAWAGMRAEPFEQLGGKPIPQAWPMIWFGLSRVIAGGLLILLAHGLVALHLNPDLTYVLVSAVLLVGFSLILHFGLLSISAGMWRLSGVNTYYLFRKPALATNLTEFWSKRWNLAFSEMTAVAIFRPLKNKTGIVTALLISFIFSGLLHELALSVPVNTGYGLPMLYFIIQALVVLAEKGLLNRQNSFLRHKVLAHVWVFFWLVIPMPLLFHTHFMREIVWPLAGLK